MFNYYVVGAAADFPVPLAIERFVNETNVVAIDGRPDWTAEKHETLDRLDFRSVRKVQAIVGSGAPGTFYTNLAYRHVSSTRDFDTDFLNWTYLRYGMPLQLKQLESDRRKVSENSVTLASIVEGADCGAPDLIYADVEGGEFDLLSAAVDILKGSVLRIDLEAQFVPMFQDQHLFDEILRLMRSCGFLLSASTFGLWTPFERRSNLPTKGFPVTGHAEFIKDPRLIAEMNDPLRAALKAAVLHVGRGDLLYADHMLTKVVPDLVKSGHNRLPKDMPEYMKFALRCAKLLEQGEGGFAMPGRFSKQNSPAWYAQNRREIERVRATAETELERFLRENGFDQTADDAKAFRQQSVQLADRHRG